MKETNQRVNCARVAMATLWMRRKASKPSMIRCTCSRIVDIDHMRTMRGVGHVQRGFCTLLSKRDDSCDRCNRACRVSVGKKAVATQNMENAPLRQASHIGAVVPTYTTFFVFWASFTYVKEATATFPHATPLLHGITMLRPQGGDLKKWPGVVLINHQND